MAEHTEEVAARIHALRDASLAAVKTSALVRQAFLEAVAEYRQFHQPLRELFVERDGHFVIPRYIERPEDV